MIKQSTLPFFSTLYMNDTIYKDIITPWIPHYQRVILEQADMWLLPVKRITYDTHYCGFLVDIVIHGGVPCQRYCICRYFSNKDKALYYRDAFEFYPFHVEEKCKCI